MSDELPRPFASPPCFAHELEPGYVDPGTAQDVARWRKAERARLIAARLAIPAEERTRIAGEVARVLDELVATRPGTTISIYWPFKGELDLRGWMHGVVERGARVVLPVVVEKARPLAFREWSPGCAMTRGVWNIPIPADGEELTPTVVVSPVIGFDPGCYRLGYGGGFYDRTLAALAPRPRVIGVGLDLAAIPTIYPQPHDIPMDLIVTGAGGVLRRPD